MTRKKYESKIIRSIKSQGIPHIMACKLSSHWMKCYPGRITLTSLPPLMELLYRYLRTYERSGGVTLLPGYDKSGVRVDMYYIRDEREYEFSFRGVLL
jgi:hypothetical protein